MKTKKNKTKSLVNLCLKYFATSIMLLLIIYIITNILVNRYLENSFLTIDSILRYEDALYYDDFTSIPLKKFKHADFIVFNNEFDVVFSTNKELNNQFTEEKIDLINNYSNNIYFEVNTMKNESGEDLIIITKVLITDGSYNEVKKYAILDKDLNIIDGNLFKKKKKITSDELNFIKGKYSNNKDIEKSIYENHYGEKRTLIFISNNLDLNSYSDTLRESNYIWLTLIPATIFIITFSTFFFIRSINKTLTPLNKELIIYEITKKLNIEEGDVPAEFKSIVKNLKELINHLEKINLENASVYKERNRVISNISHDLKTPLTVIKGYSKAFLDGIVPKEKEAKYLKAIYSKATISSDIIDTLFEYTKLEHPNYQMNLSEVDIHEFLKNYLTVKQNEIELEKYQFKYTLNETHEKYIIDEKLLLRLFNNIISNSLKYNQKKTTIYFDATISKNRLKILISDNGIGIKKELIDTAFDPFTMGDTSRNTDSSTGLGLSIAKKVVDLHNGSIRIVKKPRKPYSTQIEIIIPRKDF